MADALDVQLNELGYHTYVLDGDNIRAGLNSDLGFSEGDRRESTRRVGEVARLLVDAGLIVLVAIISPYEKERAAVRRNLPEGCFVEVHCDCPLEVCITRDVKGLYARAIAGEIEDFTGVSAPYETPSSPEVYLDTSRMSVDHCVTKVIQGISGWLRRHNTFV